MAALFQKLASEELRVRRREDQKKTKSGMDNSKERGNTNHELPATHMVAYEAYPGQRIPATRLTSSHHTMYNSLIDRYDALYQYNKLRYSLYKAMLGLWQEREAITARLASNAVTSFRFKVAAAFEDYGENEPPTFTMLHDIYDDYAAYMAKALLKDSKDRKRHQAFIEAWTALLAVVDEERNADARIASASSRVGELVDELNSINSPLIRSRT
jgi:hypothetical protein